MGWFPDDDGDDDDDDDDDDDNAGTLNVFWAKFELILQSILMTISAEKNMIKYPKNDATFRNDDGVCWN
jgi:hypothetical protein